MAWQARSGKLTAATMSLLFLFVMAACAPRSSDAPDGAGRDEAEGRNSGTVSPAETTEITVFPGPSIHSAPLWMALEQGYYEEAGLEVDMRSFPSGTTALETFRTGLGDIVLAGDWPAVNHWFNVEGDFRVIAPLQRDTEGYVIMAQTSIQEPGDLRGKRIATRVGSTGSWFVSEYLTQNGISEDEVEVINLDTNQMPTALDRGEIDAFFIWEPFGIQAQEISGDRVHKLDDATGYVQGYSLIGARPDFLEEQREAVIAFVTATDRGAEFVRNNPEEVRKFLVDDGGQEQDLVERQLEFSNFVVAFDDEFYRDFSSISDWASDHDLISEPLEFSQFIWTDGLETVDPSRVGRPADSSS